MFIQRIQQAVSKSLDPHGSATNSRIVWGSDPTYPEKKKQRDNSQWPQTLAQSETGSIGDFVVVDSHAGAVLEYLADADRHDDNW
jgi:hypothetical protein